MAETAHDKSDNGESHEHSAASYIKIWAILLVLLIISILGPTLEIKLITLVTAFGIAIVKAYMVCAYFMHLNVEKKIVLYMLASMMLFMVVLFAGFAPDILAHQGNNWYKKSFAEELPENHMKKHHGEEHADPAHAEPAHDAPNNHAETSEHDTPDQGASDHTPEKH